MKKVIIGLNGMLSIIFLVGITLGLMALPRAFSERVQEPEDFYGLCLISLFLALAVTTTMINSALLVRLKLKGSRMWKCAPTLNLVVALCFFIVGGLGLINSGNNSSEMTIAFLPSALILLTYYRLRRAL